MEQVAVGDGAGRVGRAVFAVGPAGEDDDPVLGVKFEQSLSCGEHELLIAAPASAPLFGSKRDGRFAAGDETIGPGLRTHADRHLGQVSADLFGGPFEFRCGVHRVRIAESLGFEACGIDGRRVVADDEIRDDAATRRRGGLRFFVALLCEHVEYLRRDPGLLRAETFEHLQGVGGGSRVRHGRARGDDVERIAEDVADDERRQSACAARAGEAVPFDPAQRLADRVEFGDVRAGPA